MIDLKNIDFHPKYVNPFYLGLMNLNFAREEIVSNPLKFLKSVKALRNELNNEEIIQLLNHNWRPSKVGAWIIGLCKIEELEFELIKYLNLRPTHSEHVIINLTIFNSKKGTKSLSEYVENQLSQILTLTKSKEEYNAGSMFESNSLIWGFNALKYLDSINLTTSYSDLINSELWNSIKKEWLEISKKNPRALGFYNMFLDAEIRDLGLEKSMKLIKKEDDMR